MNIFINTIIADVHRTYPTQHPIQNKREKISLSETLASLLHIFVVKIKNTKLSNAAISNFI